MNLNIPENIYKRPPLPFRGNKKRWLDYLIKYFIRNHDKFKDYTFIDVFGGSGIISQAIAKLYPNNKVIYNDYDNYTSLLKPSSINKLNELRRKIYEIANKYEHAMPINNDDSLKIKRLIIKYYPNYENNEKIKNILSSWLIYDANGFTLQRKYYNMVIKNDLEVPNDYLSNNVIIEHLDYKQLIQKYHSILNKSILILDPPYYFTPKTFLKINNWNKDDTSLLIKLCIQYKCILFESDKKFMIKLIKDIKPNIKYNLIKSKQIIEPYGPSKKFDYMITFNI